MLKELRKKRADKVQEARNILEKSKTEKRNMNADEQKSFDSLMDEADEIEADIRRQERLENTEKDLSSSAGTIVPTSGNNPEERGGTEKFLNIGEFIDTMRKNPSILEERGLKSSIGEEGGYLIPEEVKSELMSIKPGESIVRPNATVIPAGDSPDSPVSIPVLKQGADGLYGGVEVQWTGEGKEIPETDAKLDNIKLTPHEVTAKITVSNKLLRNAPAFSKMLSNLMRKALLSSEDVVFLNGDGIAKPLGIIKSSGSIKVTRTTAGDIKYEDILNMEEKLLPDSQGDAFWTCSQSGFKKVKDIKDASGNRIYTDKNVPEGFIGTLDGIPIKFTGKVSKLGDEGDLSLIDPKYYLIKDGLAPIIAISIHEKFSTNQTVIKLVRSLDGQSWIKEPLKLEDGSTEVSPFVVLK